MSHAMAVCRRHPHPRVERHPGQGSRQRCLACPAWLCSPSPPARQRRWPTWSAAPCPALTTFWRYVLALPLKPGRHIFQALSCPKHRPSLFRAWNCSLSMRHVGACFAFSSTLSPLPSICFLLSLASPLQQPMAMPVFWNPAALWMLRDSMRSARQLGWMVHSFSLLVSLCWLSLRCAERDPGLPADIKGYNGLAFSKGALRSSFLICSLSAGRRHASEGWLWVWTGSA